MMSREKGNAILEMLLYMPSAFFLLFVTGDLGLRWVEQNALSSMIQTELREASVQHVQGSERAPIDANAVSARMYERIAARIHQLQHQAIGQPKPYSLVVEVLRVPVNPSTGKLVQQHTSVLAYRGDASFSRSQSYLATSDVSSLLRVQPALSAQKGYSLRYEDELVLLYVRVRTRTQGFNSALILSVFGKWYEAEEEVLYEVLV